jgi:cytochrome c-type biogenesis protein CcmE
MKKKTITALLSIVAVIGAVIYLLVSGFDDTVVYYKTVNELLADPGRFETRPVRINGILVKDSVRAKPGTDEYIFQLIKKNQTLDVAYRGILPDTMQDGRELVVQGVYDSRAKIFNASEVLTKCPSKYEAKAEAAN